MNAIQTRSGSEFSNPTDVVLAANETLAATARFNVLVFQTAGGFELTVPSKRTHMVTNAGGYTFVLKSTGHPNVTMDINSTAFVCWDAVLGQHRIVMQTINVDSAMSSVSTNPVQNKIVKSYVDAAVAGGGGGAGAVQVDTIAALRALETTPLEVYVKGHTTVGDGGEGTFRLLASSGRNTADIDSSGDDDNGWHIVCTTTGAMYGRDDAVCTPEHFGAVGSVDATAAAAAANQWAKLNRWRRMWAFPEQFPGIASVRGISRWAKPRFEAHARFYRCDDTLDIEIPVGSPTWYGGSIPSELMFYGSLFKLSTANFPSFRVRAPRNAGKPKVQLRYYKQLTGGKAGWNATTFPQRYRDPAVYRTWTATTEFYRDEEIKYEISGVVYLYRVTQSGTTDSTVPTTSTSEQTSGTCKFVRLGSITTTGGKWQRDHICETRDIGVWVDNMDGWHELYVDGENTLIGLFCCPRGGNGHAVGFSTIHCRYLLGSKWAAVIANHLLDYAVANATERKALTGVPYLSVVRQSDDAINDYVFTGAAGTESSDGSWTTRAARTGVGWANDIRLKMNLAYGRGNVVADNTQSTYGLVQTVFGSNIGPSGNWADDIGVEYSNPSPATNVEMVQTLYDSGDEHEVQVRNDNAQYGSAAIHLRHVDKTETPKYNATYTLRAGKRLNALAWQNDRNNGMINQVYESPYLPDRIVEYSVMDLFSDAVFSGKDRIYWRNAAIWQISETVPRQYADYRTAADENLLKVNSGSRSFDTGESQPWRQAFAAIVEIPVNHTGMALLEIEHCHATVDSSLDRDGRFSVAVFNPLTGSGFVDPNTWPVLPVEGNPNLFRGASSSHYYCWPGSDRTDPSIVAFAPWVRKALVRIWGKQLTGFRLRLHNAPNGRIYAPGKVSGRGDQYVAAKPERGVWKAPTRLLYANASTNVIELNKGAGDTEYWATSGTTTSLAGVEVAYQWAHNGSGTVYERSADNTTWNVIATGVQALSPTDWQDLA